MSGKPFFFRDFVIYQHLYNTRVTTDTFLLLASIPSGFRNVLELGTGNGAIAIYASLKNKQAKIDALDISVEAVEQALQNVKVNKLEDKVRIHHSDAADFKPIEKYDLILSNPPFFHAGPAMSNDSLRKQSRHQEYMSAEVIARVCHDCLADKGEIILIYPSDQAEKMSILMAQKNIHMYKQISVLRKQNKSPFRAILYFKKGEKRKPDYKELAIRSLDDDFTGEYKLFTDRLYLQKL